MFLTVNQLLSSESISIVTLKRHQREDKIRTTLFPIQYEYSIAENVIVKQRQDITYSINRRILLLKTIRKNILISAHKGHPGIVWMKRQLRRLYWWPGQDTYLERFVKFCLSCQNSEKSQKRQQEESTCSISTD